MADRSGFAKKLEYAANIAIIVLAIVIAGMFLRQSRGSRQELHRVAVGSHFNLQNVDWRQSPRHLVFALSTTCHFCTESAPFYRRLVEECKRRNIPTVAVMPQSAAEAKNYLQNESVTMDRIVQSPLSDLEISGTPTLVLVDCNVTVKDAWFGKLPPSKENDLLTRIQQSN